MVWCDFCGRNCELPQFDNGYLCCSNCGKVILEDNFSNEPTFVKNAAGQSQMSGNVVRSVQSDYSRERTMKAALENMKFVTTSLHMDDGDTIIGPALAFYRIAVERNFTRGRKRELVEAACLYVACRDKNKPYLLIDFSEHLRVNVYVLGATFLQLCKLLSLEEHPVVQKPVDPSLFMHRFANSLVGQNYMGVSRTAVKIIASMKRDWMQTGRKPSGLCGAALYISALAHGLTYSKSEIIRIVHICEATLTKRLIEFENTESGSLTIEEFNLKAEELEKEHSSKKQSDSGLKLSGISDLLCEHKGSGIPSFAHGLCKDCNDKFIEISGGLEGGSEPPAFQRAERERMAKKSAEGNTNDSTFGIKLCPGQNSKHLNIEKEPSIKEASRKEKIQFIEPCSNGVATERVVNIESAFDKSQDVEDMSTKACDESESLSDIDDVEVDSYLHNEEEKRYKKIIWEEMNKEYIEEQAAKEAAAAAAKEAYMAKFQNCLDPEDLQAAQELAAAAAAAVAKARKERQQKRAAEAKNLTPAQTAAEATRQMLTKKRLSSKINYDALEKLFDESELPENPKKIRTELHSKNDDSPPHIIENNLEAEEMQKDGDLEQEDDFEDVGNGAYGNDFDDYNAGEAYDYDDDYGDADYFRK